jgi:hypothetical protein
MTEHLGQPHARGVHSMAPKKIITTIELGTFYRYSDYDTPFWARSNTRSGRWHTAGDGPTQYLSSTTDGAWADLIRNEDLRTEADIAMIQMPLWQCKIDQSYIVDYSDFEKAAAAGFPPEALIADDQERCRVEGKRLRDLGYTGIVAPAAALPGETSLTLFGGRVLIDWSGSPRLASSIPAAILSVGAPPPGLLARTRLYGQKHAGYEEYRTRTAAAQKARPRRKSSGGSGST